MVAGMAPKPVFIIHAWYADRGTGAFDMAAETKEAALQKARRLSDQGFSVKITGPDGEVVPGDTTICI